MLAFQSILLFGLIYCTPYLQKISLFSLLFYVLFLLNYIFYFFASQSSPGFITLQDLNFVLTAKENNFSDERSVSFSVEVPDASSKSIKSVAFNKLNEENVADLTPQTINTPKIKDMVNTNRSEEEEKAEERRESGSMNDIQILEIRHCTICRIDQPIRTKHCRDCGKCVATHDHHCPWLGVCIGEKNKKSFYRYLMLQITQLLWANVWVRYTQNFVSFEASAGVVSWLADNWLRLFIAVVINLFTVMVGGLLGFHAYLASVNLTTWEFMSWNKISYLKNLDWKNGSPFTNGLFRNFYHNCCKKGSSYFIQWQVRQTTFQK